MVGEATPMAALGGDTAARLRVTVGQLSRRLRRMPVSCQLTPSQVAVLGTVVRSGRVRPSDLCSLESLNPTMLSRVVARLQALGLVERQSDPGDGRAVLIAPTPEGRRLQGQIRSQRDTALSQQLGQLPAEHRELLDQALPVLEEVAEALRQNRR